MSFKQILTELENIPIKTYKPDPKDTPERIEPRKQEADTNIRFSLNDYKLRTGKVIAQSEEELDKLVDSALEKIKSNMGMVYDYSQEDGKFIAHVIWYDRDVSRIEEKYKKALKNKIESEANERSKGNTKAKEPEASPKTKIISNIQKILDKLSDKDLADIEKYAKAVERNSR